MTTPSHNTEIELKEIVKDIEDISPAWFNAREKQAIFRVLHTLTTNIEKRRDAEILRKLREHQNGWVRDDGTGNPERAYEWSIIEDAIEALSPKERSMGKKFTCKDDEACGVCQVCEYLSWLEYAMGCAPAGSEIQRNEKIENYLASRTQAKLLSE